MVKEYNKIGVIFNRDVDGTKKLIDGDFKSETVEYLKNNIWTFTEKLMERIFGFIGTAIRFNFSEELIKQISRHIW